MEYQASAAFTLAAVDLDPGHVTAVTGVQPSKTWRTGDLIDPRTPLRYTHNGWRVDSKISADLDEQIRDVYSRLQPAWAQFEELGERYYAEISCVLYIYGGARPPMHFDREIVERAAQLHAAIDIDLYVLPRGRPKRAK